MLSLRASLISQTCIVAARARSCSTVSGYNYETLKVKPESEYVYSVTLDRPKKKNAMSKTMWTEISQCFTKLSEDPKCRSIVLTGGDSIFSAGIDLQELMNIGQGSMDEEDTARKAFKIKNFISPLQDSFTQLEKCRKPIITAVDGPAIGLAVDLLCATDIRLCSQNSFFQVKEIAMGLAADIGTLQRLPKIIGSQSLVFDLALSARKMQAEEALSSGFVSHVYPDYAATFDAAVKLASDVAAKSPVAAQVTKMALYHARDNSVQDSLDYIALLNMTMLQSEDVRIAALNQMARSEEKPQFGDL